MVSRSMALALLAALAGGASRADAGREVADGRAAPAERLDSMKAALASYSVARQGERPAALRLRDEPVFRIGRQSGNLLDGAIFLWTGEDGRPEAAMQAFLLREPEFPRGKWLHEFTSLSTDPLRATRGGKERWAPSVAGLEFRPVPGAPLPGTTPAARLRQMRALAGEFRADDNFGDRGWEPLRMLTAPITRYGEPGGTPEDGALFAFVEGTDPEVFLFLEVRDGPAGRGWSYGLAPMGCWAVKVKHKGQEVWSLPRRSTGDPSKPLYNYQFWP